MDQITGSLNATGNITGALNPVYGTGASALSELDDVDINGALVGDVLMLMNMSSGVNKWSAYPSLFISEKFFNDYELDILWVMGSGIAQISFDNDISNKVIDIHFTSPNVCPDNVRVRYDEQTLKWWIQISIPEEYYDENLKCLLTLRDVKGS